MAEFEEMLRTKVVDIYYTVGTNCEGKTIPFGEFHRDRDLAQLVANRAPRGLKNIHVIHRRTCDGNALFLKLLKEGVKED